MSTVKFACVTVLLGLGAALPAQTLFAPSGVVGSSTNAYVGIGTSTPEATLHVNGSSKFQSYLVVKGTTGHSRIVFESTESGGKQYEWYNDVYGTGSFGIYNRSEDRYPFVVSAAGNVGISAVNPRSRLDLGGKVGAGKGLRVGDYFEVNEREVVNNAVSIGFNASIAADDGTYVPAHAPGSGMVMVMETGGDADIDFYGRNWGGSSTPVNLGSFTHVMRLATNGRVGIGTTLPADALDVATGAVRVRGNATTGQASSAVLDFYSGFTRLISAGANTSTKGGFQFYVANSNSSTVIEALRVDTDGDVGIGTTSPTHKLTVNGTIRAKEVIVDTDWADYVFAEDYRLAPLSEVEAHIKEHKHLPGIPSAAEVAEQGVSMGEMQAKMMAKIEELTLHVIEQEKRARDHERRARAQDEEIATLRAEVARLSTSN